jgi:transposase
MQTFLPYEDFAKSAEVLDPSRLGNQFYRECLTLIRGKWPNHPASKMWVGHRFVLCQYALACYEELRLRGSDYEKHANEVLEHMKTFRIERSKPWWLGDPDFHQAHRSNLTRKDPNWYGQYWDESPDLPYLWPVEYGKFRSLHSAESEYGT